MLFLVVSISKTQWDGKILLGAHCGVSVSSWLHGIFALGIILVIYIYWHMSILTSKGFPDSSVGKELAWNAGDPSLIPGLGRSAGERIGYPLQDSWASLVAQQVKNPPAMWETWVLSLGWDITLEKNTTVFQPGEIHGLYGPWGCKASDTTGWLSLSSWPLVLIPMDTT